MENQVCDTLINVDSCVEPPSSQAKTISTCCSSQDGEGKLNYCFVLLEFSDRLLSKASIFVPEVGSEAASNQSEDSSMDLEAEDQNDNLSDMISANVSGRGTPNISGKKILYIFLRRENREARERSF